MSLKQQLPRPQSPEIAAWGAKVLAPDHPYRRIGDVFYPELYPLYIEDFAAIPVPAELTPVDLAFVLAFQHHERLSFDTAALYLHTRMDWKYALHVPLDHRGCTSHDLKTVAKHVELADPPLNGPILSIAEVVRQCFAAE